MTSWNLPELMLNALYTPSNLDKDCTFLFSEQSSTFPSFMWLAMEYCLSQPYHLLCRILVQRCKWLDKFIFILKNRRKLTLYKFINMFFFQSCFTNRATPNCPGNWRYQALCISLWGRPVCSPSARATTCSVFFHLLLQVSYFSRVLFIR